MSAPQHIGLALDCLLSYPRRILRGIKQYAQTKPDWALLIHDTISFGPLALSTMKPAGVIAMVTSNRLDRTLSRAAAPVVNVSLALPESSLPRVAIDNREVGRIASRHLTERGLKHFGVIGHPWHRYSVDREAGFRSDLADRGFDCNVFHDRSNLSYAHRGRLLALRPGMQRWLLRLPRPAGVFACHDLWGLQVIEACRLVGLRVPDDVAVIGADNDELLANLSRPSLSSVMIPGERVGYEAAALLDGLMQGSRRPRREMLIAPLGAVVRESTDVLAGADPDLSEALRLIRESVHRPLSVSDVLQAVPVSRRSLERQFQELLHRGIAEEIRRSHIDHARRLLAETALSVATVAQQSGFRTLHHFSRVFRRETGESPTEFRRRYQPGQDRPLADAP